MREDSLFIPELIAFATSYDETRSAYDNWLRKAILFFNSVKAVARRRPNSVFSTVIVLVHYAKEFFPLRRLPELNYLINAIKDCETVDEMNSIVAAFRQATIVPPAPPLRMAPAPELLVDGLAASTPTPRQHPASEQQIGVTSVAGRCRTCKQPKHKHGACPWADDIAAHVAELVRTQGPRAPLVKPLRRRQNGASGAAKCHVLIRAQTEWAFLVLLVDVPSRPRLYLSAEQNGTMRRPERVHLQVCNSESHHPTRRTCEKGSMTD